MSVADPGEIMLKAQEGDLPGITGMLMIDEENPHPRVFNFQGMKVVSYTEVLKTLLQMIPEKIQAYEKD